MESNTQGPSGRWWAFAAGIAIGVALSALGVAAAMAAQRRARSALAAAERASDAEASRSGSCEASGVQAARVWPEDSELDEELEQTFPASDPLPYSHRVD